MNHSPPAWTFALAALALLVVLIPFPEPAHASPPPPPLSIQWTEQVEVPCPVYEPGELQASAASFVQSYTGPASTLEGVRYEFQMDFTAPPGQAETGIAYGVENRDVSQPVNGYDGTYGQILALDFRDRCGGGSRSGPITAWSFQVGLCGGEVLAPSDGVVDFAGPSGHTGGTGFGLVPATNANSNAGFDLPSDPAWYKHNRSGTTRVELRAFPLLMVSGWYGPGHWAAKSYLEPSGVHFRLRIGYVNSAGLGLPL